MADFPCAVGKIQFVEKLRMAEDNLVRKPELRSTRLVNPLLERLFYFLVTGEVPAVRFRHALCNLLSLPFVQGSVVLSRLCISGRHAVAPKRTETSLDTPGSCIVTPYNTGAMLMVFLLWVIKTNWV